MVSFDTSIQMIRKRAREDSDDSKVEVSEDTMIAEVSKEYS